MTPQQATGFRASTTRANGRLNKIVTRVTVSEAFDPADPPNPPPRQVEVEAIWDTGATGSVLAPSTIASLGLIPTGVTDIHTPGGSRRATTYIVNLVLPNRVIVAGVRVCDCQELRGGHGALIGMDIISAGDFSITNVNGQTYVSFRIPSMQTIDYVHEARQTRFAGVGRNEPCPCGAKKPDGHPVKFKHCHERASQAAPVAAPPSSN